MMGRGYERIRRRKNLIFFSLFLSFFCLEKAYYYNDAFFDFWGRRRLSKNNTTHGILEQKISGHASNIFPYWTCFKLELEKKNVNYSLKSSFLCIEYI